MQTVSRSAIACPIRMCAASSTGVFNGVIDVRPGADGTDARQLNDNLLLSDRAEANTQPRLEMLADDVACNNGATIGQLDDAALSYLRTRGIDATAARRLPIDAVARQAVDAVADDAVRTWITERIGSPDDEQPVGIASNRRFTLPRDCVVTIVPAGHLVTLAQGTKVTVRQALGGTATVTTNDGEMARLDPTDSVEFGLVQHSPEPAGSAGSEFDIDDVWAAAATVYDPEIPVDIVELGLVYRVDVQLLPDGGRKVEIDMSVTAPFCGMGDIPRQDLHDAVSELAGVEAAEITLVFDPPWDASRLSDVARLELGMM